MTTHHELFPEQYSHPLVGQRVRVGSMGPEGVVARVVQSGSGQLAVLEGTDASTAYSVCDCKIIDDERDGQN